MENGDLICQSLEYMDEVVKDYQSPEKVKIHDMPLRDGEQQAGVIFAKDDKIHIAERLGIELSEDQASEVLQDVKLLSHDLKRVLIEAEFRETVDMVKAKEKPWSPADFEETQRIPIERSYDVAVLDITGV